MKTKSLTYDEKQAVLHIMEHLLGGMVGIRGFDMNLLNLMGGRGTIRLIGREPTHVMLSPASREALLGIVENYIKGVYE